MKYIKKYEDLNYTKDEKKDYTNRLEVLLGEITTKVEIKQGGKTIEVKPTIIADSVNLDGLYNISYVI